MSQTISNHAVSMTNMSSTANYLMCGIQNIAAVTFTVDLGSPITKEGAAAAGQCTTSAWSNSDLMNFSYCIK